ncbi:MULTISPECIES: dTDP-4-dehydrorhamnose reductase [Burkholderia]|uniref:dTDP-4-dehydrorhamnose reductase n=1 Tax=Burkholderia cepacia TaxID=292 RepID=A0AAQ0F8P1_BURCE|nr:MULTISPECIES: dTDP-4-dehydrorhamnose reductase [Burkholderia]MCR5891536.1 dTDP-4-dehydrorhamnose reductase [Burkholderia sp. HAN2018]NTX21165.1 dTDP-4-dehydrorhamnose reductase [Burkholderia cepacia]RAQ03264.1 dTDP-4-dehydrorhamnose reductase [Burkholderia cepacia]
MRRILISGANGQVGFELCRSLAPLGAVSALTRQDMDLGKADSILAVLDRERPDVIVNPAAYTAVDKAESEPDVARAINGTAPGVMAEWAAAHGAMIVHYSTDYVFSGSGTTAYRESDPTDPQSIYGTTKWEGEQAVRNSGCRHLILRTSWVVGAHGANFLKTILRLAGERDQLKIVADQVGAPTSASLIADVTAHLVARQGQQPDAFGYGTYHLAASGETTWHEYACHVVASAERRGLALKLKSKDIQPIATHEYPLPATRPANSRLDCGKLTSAFGLHLPNWRLGVDHVFSEIHD